MESLEALEPKAWSALLSLLEAIQATEAASERGILLWS